MKTLKNIILPRIPEGEEEISRWREALLELNEELRLQVYEDIYELNNKSKMRYKRPTSQDIPSVSHTVILFTDKDFDLLDEYTSSNGRFTASMVGYYQVNASSLLNNCTFGASDIFVIQLYKNGETYSMGYRSEAQVAGSYYMSSRISDLIYLEADDYIDIRVYQNTGLTTTLYSDSSYNYFSVHRI